MLVSSNNFYNIKRFFYFFNLQMENTWNMKLWMYDIFQLQFYLCGPGGINIKLLLYWATWGEIIKVWLQATFTKMCFIHLFDFVAGEVVSSGYKVPQGDWFDYVSTPHQLAEILMYLALTILLYGNVTWWFVFGWVLSNQVRRSRVLYLCHPQILFNQSNNATVQNLEDYDFYLDNFAVTLLRKKILHKQ